MLGAQSSGLAQDDKTIVEDIFEEAGADKSIITRVFHLGKEDRKGEYSHPIKILTTSYEQKLLVLTCQKNVIGKVSQITDRGKQVFLRHDWTPRQLEQDKLLRVKLDTTRKENPMKGFKIRNGEIVEIKGWVPGNTSVIANGTRISGTVVGEFQQNME